MDTKTTVIVIVLLFLVYTAGFVNATFHLMDYQKAYMERLVDLNPGLVWPQLVPE